MKVNLWPEVLVSSVTLAAIYIPIAMSWVVIFRTTKVLNFATGEYAILGAYFLYVFRSTLSLPWGVAVVLALILSAALGAVTYAGLLRFLTGRPLWAPVVLTMGIAFVLDAIMAIFWGGQLFLPLPARTHKYSLGAHVTFSTVDVIAVVAAVATVVLATLVLGRSRLGARMRAAAESPLLASQSGINIDRMFTLGWALAAVVAAIGGISYCIGTDLEPGNVTVGVLGLAPAIVGGLDSVGGVVVGSVIVALITSFATLYVGASALSAISAGILLVILLTRPYGLFGVADVNRV